MSYRIDSATGVLKEVLRCRPEYYEWLATSHSDWLEENDIQVISASPEETARLACNCLRNRCGVTRCSVSRIFAENM